MLQWRCFCQLEHFIHGIILNIIQAEPRDFASYCFSRHTLEGDQPLLSRGHLLPDTQRLEVSRLPPISFQAYSCNCWALLTQPRHVIVSGERDSFSCVCDMRLAKNCRNNYCILILTHSRKQWLKVGDKTGKINQYAVLWRMLFHCSRLQYGMKAFLPFPRYYNT